MHSFLSSLYGLLLCIYVLSAGSARADLQWSDDFIWNRARMITPEQHNWSFRSSFQHSETRFGSEGAEQPLGEPFGRTWSWGEIRSGGISSQARARIDRYMQANDLNDNDLAAVTDFSLKREDTTLALAWAYGMTSKWMVGLQIPITIVDTQVSARTALTPGLARAFASADVEDEVGMSQSEVRSEVQSAVEHRMVAEGYGQMRSHMQSLIVGDVSLLSQVSLWQTNDWAISLQQLVRIPSAPNPSLSDYIRFSRDDGQIDLGLTAMLDYQWRRFLFGLRGGYIAQLGDTQKMRVPLRDQNQNVQMVDRRVKRDLGDMITTSAETIYTIGQRWGVNLAYLGFFKQKDRYNGEVNGAAYWQLSANSDQSLHMARGGVAYLIGRASSRSGLQRKWMANLNVYQPVSGRNVTRGTTGALEIQAYF